MLLGGMARWMTRAAVALAVVLGVATPTAAAAAAAPMAIDPRCDVFGVAGFMEVIDPSEAADNLPTQITFDDLSCIIRPPGQDIYVYFDDPLQKLIETIGAFT